MQRKKTTLRQQFIARRCSLSANEQKKYSQQICANLQTDKQFDAAQRVLIFAALDGEPDLLSLLADRDKQWFFPRVELGGELSLHRVHSVAELAVGEFGVREPSGSAVAAEIALDLIITPALAVDARGTRLGFGGGYYDRLLAHYPTVPTLAAVFDCCRAAAPLPQEAHDLPVARVVSERGIFACQ